MRLIDKIRRVEWNEIFQEFIRNREVFVIDNVAEYAFVEAARTRDHWTLNDFPNVAPPFENMWFEYHLPKVDGKGDEMGVFGQYARSVGYALDVIDASQLTFRDTQTGETRLGPDNDCKWVLKSRLAYEEMDKSVSICDGMEGYLSLSSSGSILSLGFNLMEGMSHDETGFLEESFNFLMVPVALALSFLHCRNVTSEVVHPDPKLQRATLRRKHPPLFSHRTININPMRKVLRSEGRSEEVGLRRALHICRGHFSHYSEDKPLFGKVAGTFWVPSHVRGSRDAGVATKDYRITIPKQAA